MIPPGKERPGPVERIAGDQFPGLAERGLEGEHMRRPLGRGPEPEDQDRKNSEDLTEKEFGGRHGAALIAQAPRRR